MPIALGVLVGYAARKPLGIVGTAPPPIRAIRCRAPTDSRVTSRFTGHLQGHVGENQIARDVEGPG